MDFVNKMFKIQKNTCKLYGKRIYLSALNKNDIDSNVESAERLMRTRYSAFVLQKADYIVKTTVPAQQALLDIESIEKWAKDELAKTIHHPEDIVSTHFIMD